MEKKKTVIVTGASRGIGAAITQGLLDHGYNVVANSRNISKSDLTPSSTLALVDGDIGNSTTAESRGPLPKSRTQRFAPRAAGGNHRSARALQG